MDTRTKLQSEIAALEFEIQKMDCVTLVEIWYTTLDDFFIYISKEFGVSYVESWQRMKRDKVYDALREYVCSSPIEDDTERDISKMFWSRFSSIDEAERKIQKKDPLFHAHETYITQK